MQIVKDGQNRRQLLTRDLDWRPKELLLLFSLAVLASDQFSDIAKNRSPRERDSEVLEL